MPQNASRLPGRHFLQIPGPTPVPDRIMRAMDMPLIDHRGPEFAKLAKRVLEGIKTIFKTTQPVINYTATGTGAWEAALVNTLSPGDRVLMVETGQFATLWKVMAERLGLKPEFIKTDWRVGADPKIIEEHLRKDKAHEIKAVCVLHNETATGCLSPISAIRKAIDAAGHPALFLVDTISSLASTDYYSPTITAVLLPDGHDADQFRNVALNTFNISYGASFGPYVKKYFRIGHLGDINDATLIGALAATEMTLKLAGVPHKKGGVQAAMDYIVSAQAGGARAAAE